MGAEPALSVVVPTRNRPRYLERSLAAYARQSLAKSRFEVVVADNGSGPETRAVVAALRRRALFRLRYVRAPKPGAAAARNAGAAAARGRALAFLDDSCMPHPDCLREYERAHRAAPGRVLVGSVAGVLSCWSRELLAGVRSTGRPLPIPRAGAAQWLFEVSDVLARFPDVPLFPVRWHGAESQRRGDPLDWRTFVSANVFLPRALFQEHGGFDERFRGAGGEDTELAYRLQRAGAVFARVPTALCYHQHHPIDRSAAAGRLFRRNLDLFCRLHPGRDTAAARRRMRRWSAGFFAGGGRGARRA